MNERILIAGSGGQGIISIGKVLAAVATRSVPHVTFFPAYGAEVRGGTSNCQVMLADEEIASPVSEQFDAMVVLNQASLDRFAGFLAPGGVIVANSSMCDVDECSDIAAAIPATDEAIAQGDARCANTVMLGAFLAVKPVVPVEAVRQAISDAFAVKGAELVELNLRAFERGLELAGGSR